MTNTNLISKKSGDDSFKKIKQSPIQDSEDVNEAEFDNNAKTFTNLRNEILGKIMDLLSFDDLFNLESVNKRMREVSLNVAWLRRNTLDENSINYVINSKDDNELSKKKFSKIKSILSRANIKYIELSNYSSIIIHQICLKLYLAPQLIKLDLKYVNLKNGSLKIIANSCPLLENASFCCWFPEEVVNIEKGLESIFKKCLKLRHLTLVGMVYTGKCFAYIPQELQRLTMEGVLAVTSNAMELLSNRANNLETLIMTCFFPTADVNIWLKKLTKLRFLRISCSSENLPHLDLSCLTELEMLCLRGNSLITIDTLKSLKHCPKLKGLDLMFNAQLDENALNELKSCKALKYCDFSWLRNLNNLVDLVQTLKLEYLAINDCNGIQKNVIKSLITDCNSLSQLEDFGNNHNNLRKILFEKRIQRSNILKLFVNKGKQPLPSNNWCEVVYSDHQSFRITNAIRENKTSL